MASDNVTHEHTLQLIADLIARRVAELMSADQAEEPSLTLDVKGVCSLTGLPRHTIYEAVRSRELCTLWPSEQGEKFRFSRNQAEEWLTKLEHSGRKELA
jgi:excisionase family DNA binding protein